MYIRRMVYSAEAGRRGAMAGGERVRESVPQLLQDLREGGRTEERGETLRDLAYCSSHTQ